MPTQTEKRFVTWAYGIGGDTTYFVSDQLPTVASLGSAIYAKSHDREMNLEYQYRAEEREWFLT